MTVRLISSRAQHTQNMLYTLGLEQCNSAPTPYLSKLRPENDRELDETENSLYRRCVGHSIYLSLDCDDCQHTVCAQSPSLSTPTRFDSDRLIRFGGILKVRLT